MKYTFFFLFLWMLAVNVMGQSFAYSPYSRFGLGFLQKDGGDMESFAMGGLNVSYFSNTSLAYGNPAGIAYLGQSLDSMPFLFVGNIAGQFARIEGDGKVAYPFNISLNSFGGGFKLYKKINASIGFTPFSQVDYKIKFTDSLDSLATTNFYSGRGGLNNIWLGMGWSVNKYISVGIKANYLFGSILNEKKIMFNAPNFLHAKITNQDFYHTPLYLPIVDVGVIGIIPLKRGWEIRMGLHYRPTQKFKENITFQAYRFINSGGFDYIKDTVITNDSIKGFSTLPDEWEGGIFINNGNTFGMGFQFSYSPWEKFKSLSNMDLLTKAFTVSIGGFLASSKNTAKLRKQIKWNYGFRYQQSPFTLNQQHVNQISLSLGCVMPLAPIYQKLQKSWLTFGVEMGILGSKENLRQDYILWKFGMIFTEKWFEKKLYK